MTNVMAALPNIGGAFCSTPQSLADAQYCVYSNIVPILHCAMITCTLLFVFYLFFSYLLYLSVFICVYVFCFLCYHKLVNKDLYILECRAVTLPRRETR